MNSTHSLRFSYVCFCGFLCLWFNASVHAQTPVASKMKDAQALYEFFLRGEGDSICARLNDRARAMISPSQLGGLYRALEQQFGKQTAADDWQTAEVQQVLLYFRDMRFERGALRFLTAFDADGRANTLRLVPVPPVTPVAKKDSVRQNEKSLTVRNGKFELPAILTLPEGGGKYPVAVLIHGSGPHDRDETIGPNKPFRDLADGLAARGIAVLRYDKRTKVYGASAFPSENETTIDVETTDDAVQAVRLVRTLPEIAPDRVFVIGHSLGAMLAPRIAERCGEELRGVVFLAGNARPIEDLLLEQVRYLDSISVSGRDKNQVEVLARQIENLKKLDTESFDEHTPLPLGLPRSYWISLRDYRQVDSAEGLRLPILILQGERDYQVTMRDFAIWQSALKKKSNVRFKSYPALNHLFMKGTGKPAPEEYMRRGTVDEEVTSDIADFILSVP